MKYNTEIFINKCIEKYGNRYDYSKVNYVNSQTKVCIICPIHGEFYQYPASFLQGHGCQKCATEATHKLQRSTTEEFIKKARKVHGNKYDYSKVNYINNETKVCIICDVHGEFWQKPSAHLSGSGCYKCGKVSMSEKQAMTKSEFIQRANEIHGNKYNYDKVILNGMNNKVIITCPEHGDFKQTPSSHINNKCGCPKCGNKLKNQINKLTTETFIEKAKEIHGTQYDYSKVEYVDYNTPVCIICPIHDEFWQTPDSHLQGKGCRRCNKSISKHEREINDYINQVLNIETVISVRNIIPPLELDIYVPSKQIAIEYNGILWHSEQFGKNNNYHLNKLKLCKQKGIKLIQIFEDEYLQHKEIVFNKIKHLLNISENLPKVAARKCTIKEIDSHTAEQFLNTYHIQGFVGSTIYLGGYYNDTLIGVMTFKQQTNNSDKWELTRFASDYHYICQGVGGKLFKHFIRKYNPSEVKSFADRRWTINETDNLYIKLGFEFDRYTYPDYTYVCKNGGTCRFHKFNFRKQILHKKYGLDLSMTEDEMTKELGYFKIWDCGLIRYVWNK